MVLEAQELAREEGRRAARAEARAARLEEELRQGAAQLKARGKELAGLERQVRPAGAGREVRLWS
jgi:hypothetical protein